MVDAVNGLFSPFKIKGLTLPNRIVMSPMTRWKSPGGVPGADVAAYYRRRAENDCGLIITEGTVVGHPVSSSSQRIPNFFGEALKGWRRVVEEVHGVGGRIFPQLWHVGSLRSPAQDYPNRHLPSVSPSGLYAPDKRPNADPAGKAEIKAVVDAFAKAALDARELGFDGIELHGAHGYLFDQFLWPALNRRTDEYGGSIENRTRFAVETIGAIRGAVGDDFPIFFRFSQWKQQDYNARLAETPEALGELVNILANAGVDLFDCSQRRFWEPEFAGSPLNCAGWVKKLTGKPTMSVGSIGLSGALSVEELHQTSEVTDIKDVLKRMEKNEFDLIAVGRGILADPAWARKVKLGRFSELIPFNRQALEDLH